MMGLKNIVALLIMCVFVMTGALGTTALAQSGRDLVCATAKTGDTSNIDMWVTVLAVSGCAIVAYGIFAFVKKKKK